MNFEKPLPEAFRFCPRCATEAEPIGAVPFRCDQCGFSFFFGPVTAVGVIVRDRNQQVLLIERAREPGKGQYGLPGGFVDRGETAEQALRRELHEEVGLEVTEVNYLMSLPNQYTYQGLTAAVLDLFFISQIDSFEAIQADPREVAGYWTGIPGDEQLSQMAFDSNRLALLKYLSTDNNDREPFQ